MAETTAQMPYNRSNPYQLLNPFLKHKTLESINAVRRRLNYCERLELAKARAVKMEFDIADAPQEE